MRMMRLVVCTVMLFATTAAFAHTGAPGHVHPEMTSVQQAVHAVVNWAPVLAMAIACAAGARKALRVKVRAQGRQR